MYVQGVVSSWGEGGPEGVCLSGGCLPSGGPGVYTSPCGQNS